MNEQTSRWDDLRLVLAVGRAGSLSGAARALRVSHPTVFRRVNQIERRLGVRLFERGRQGYTPTPAGDEMLALAERVEQDVIAVERRLAGQDLRPSGSVRITTTDTLLVGFLSPILAEFREAEPDIELDVAVSNEIFNISKRDADVAIRPSREVPDALVGRKVSDVAVAVYAHAELARTQPGGGELNDYRWVGPDDSLSYLPMARWLRERGLDRRVVFRTNTLLGCLDAVRHGIGVALLPCYMGDPAPELARIGAPVEALASELWLLTHPDLRKVARIRSFLDFTAEALRARRRQLEGGS